MEEITDQCPKGFHRDRESQQKLYQGQNQRNSSQSKVTNLKLSLRVNEIDR